jgi:hypothetical protein
MRRTSFRAARRAIRTTGVACAATACLILALSASAGAAVTYRSATGTCQDATLYGNYSKSAGPQDKVGELVRGEVAGFEYATGPWAWVRTAGGDDKGGFVLRDCLTIAAPGTSGSYLWPAVGTCQNATMYGSYDAKTHTHGKLRTGTVRAGQPVGYQYAHLARSSGAWAVVRKGAPPRIVYGYVLRSCIDVADWATTAAWNPPR